MRKFVRAKQAFLLAGVTHVGDKVVAVLVLLKTVESCGSDFFVNTYPSWYCRCHAAAKARHMCQ